MTDTSTAIRLAVCELTRRRFAGRAELERRAAHDPRALLELEHRLGLRSAESVAEAIGELDLAGAFTRAGELERALDVTVEAVASQAAARGQAAPCARILRAYAWRHVVQSGPDWYVHQIADRRRARAGRRAHPVRSTAERLALRRAEEAYRAAGFRVARHSHSLSVVLAIVGDEAAPSNSGSIASRDAGMSAAYCRRAFSVATSRHNIAVSAASLSALRIREPGRLYLRPDLRVVQGRGTSLVTEMLTTGRGGRLVWRRA